MSKGAAGGIGKDLLHDGVVPVLLFGLDQLYLQPQLTCL
jgi:hypothetical protein